MKATEILDEITPVCQDPSSLITIQEILKRFPLYPKNSLPQLKLISRGKESPFISFFFLCLERPHIGRFLGEMMTCWLIPPSRLPTSLLFMASFFSKIKGTSLLCGQIDLQLKSPKDIPRALSQFEILKLELELGLGSPYHATRILEMKALSLGEKRMLIQERINRIIHRFPSWYDYDIFSLVQHVLIKVSAEYFRCREVRQCAENLTFFYTVRKKFYQELDQFPQRRFIFTKLIRRKLRLPLGLKHVLGVLVGMNLLHKNEKFGKEHLLKAVESLIPELKLVPESDLLYQDTHYPFQLFYIELERKDGKRFLKEEIAILRDKLQFCIKGRIEHLHRSVFMPSNQEEILRNMVTLGRELRFMSDLPQTMISFAKQTNDQLIFTIVIARIALPDTPPIETALRKLGMKAQRQRSKVLGYIRKKYPKEALVLEVEMQAADFLRKDNCIDVYKARHKILMDLEKGLGPLRDFNGGIIAKQNEVFQDFTSILGEKGQEYRSLLETFFYNIYPAEQRSFIQPKILKACFLVLVKLLKSSPEKKQRINKLRMKECCFVLIEELDHIKQRNVEKPTEIPKIPLTNIITIKLAFEDRQFLGYLYLTEDKKHQERAFNFWEKTIQF